MKGSKAVRQLRLISHPELRRLGWRERGAVGTGGWDFKREEGSSQGDRKRPRLVNKCLPCQGETTGHTHHTHSRDTGTADSLLLTTPGPYPLRFSLLTVLFSCLFICPFYSACFNIITLKFLILCISWVHSIYS